MDYTMSQNRMAAVQAAALTDWTVAVTGVDAKPVSAGAAVARCLRAAPGFRGRILGLGREEVEPGIYASPSWNAEFTLPNPVAGATALLERIDEIRRIDPIDAIIPCLDAELPNYITLKPELARRGIRLLLPDRTTLYSRNKDYLPALCAKADVATPRVRRITHEGFFDLKGIDGEFWRYPMVVKGIFYDAYVVHSPEEAKRRFRQVAATWGYPVLVQEFVAGEEVALAALGDGSGTMIESAMLKKQGTGGQAIDDHDLHAAGRRLMAALQWRGPLEMEMLRDQSGKLHLIEINPRFPAWIDLYADAGPNLPALLLALMQDETSGCQELVQPSWWNREPAKTGDRLARFGNRGDHGMPAGSCDILACTIP